MMALHTLTTDVLQVVRMAAAFFPIFPPLSRETLQLGTFHYLIQLMASYYESMVLEKKDKVVARQWAQR